MQEVAFTSQEVKNAGLNGPSTTNKGTTGAAQGAPLKREPRAGI
jgi:hypothetical protein